MHLCAELQEQANVYAIGKSDAIMNKKCKIMSNLLFSLTIPATKQLKNGPLLEPPRWKFSSNAQRLLIQSAILTKFHTQHNEQVLESMIWNTKQNAQLASFDFFFEGKKHSTREAKRFRQSMAKFPPL